jgi:hypothetical protein
MTSEILDGKNPTEIVCLADLYKELSKLSPDDLDRLAVSVRALRADVPSWLERVQRLTADGWAYSVAVWAVDNVPETGTFVVVKDKHKPYGVAEIGKIFLGLFALCGVLALIAFFLPPGYKVPAGGAACLAFGARRFVRGFVTPKLLD